MSLTLFVAAITMLLALMVMTWVYQSKALTYNARNALKNEPKRKFSFTKIGFIIVITSSFITLSFVSIYSIYLFNVRAITTRCVTPAYDSEIFELQLCANQFGREIFTDTSEAYALLNTKYRDKLPNSNIKVTPKNITTLRNESNRFIDNEFNYISDRIHNTYDFHTNVMPKNQYETYLIDGVWLLQFKTINHNLTSSNVTFKITNLTSSEQALSSVYPILFMDGDVGVDPNLLQELNAVFEPESLKEFNVTVPHTKSLTIKINSKNVSYYQQGGPQ